MGWDDVLVEEDFRGVEFEFEPELFVVAMEDSQ